MSRHILVDRPNLQVVLGFDHMLRSFFGQVFNPADRRREGTAIAGWPTRSGLGTRSPVESYAERDRDLRLLMMWARNRQPDHVWEHPDADEHLERLRSKLRWEWEEGDDAREITVPAILRGPLS